MVQVKWNAGALRQLKNIKEFIEKDSPVQARRVIRLIREATRKLCQHPEFGAVVPEYGKLTIRELSVFHYRIIYFTDKNKIRIIAVVHGSRQLADDLLDKSNV